jgi:hypothetical protein
MDELGPFVDRSLPGQHVKRCGSSSGISSKSGIFFSRAQSIRQPLSGTRGPHLTVGRAAGGRAPRAQSRGVQSPGDP